MVVIEVVAKNYPKMAQNAISDKLKFKIFLGGMPPDPLA